jgi:hypothetical protein
MSDKFNKNYQIFTTNSFFYNFNVKEQNEMKKYLFIYFLKYYYYTRLLIFILKDKLSTTPIKKSIFLNNLLKEILKEYKILKRKHRNKY